MNLRVTPRFQREADAIEYRLDQEHYGYGQHFLAALSAHYQVQPDRIVIEGE